MTVADIEPALVDWQTLSPADGPRMEFHAGPHLVVDEGMTWLRR